MKQASQNVRGSDRTASCMPSSERYPSESAVVPGNRFSIAFDVTPKPRIHVYAPAASNYRTIAVNITSTCWMPKSEVLTAPG